MLLASSPALGVIHRGGGVPCTPPISVTHQMTVGEWIKALVDGQNRTWVVDFDVYKVLDPMEPQHGGREFTFFQNTFYTKENHTLTHKDSLETWRDVPIKDIADPLTNKLVYSYYVSEENESDIQISINVDVFFDSKPSKRVALSVPCSASIVELKERVSGAIGESVSSSKVMLGEQPLSGGSLQHHRLPQGATLHMVPPLYEPDTNISQKAKRFCSVLPPLKPPSGPSVVPSQSAVRYLNNSTKRVCWIRLYHHPDCSWDTIQQTFHIETNPQYLNQNALSVSKQRLPNLSRSALERLTQILVGGEKKQFYPIPEQVLHETLQEEHKWRTSPETQKLFAAAEVSHDIDWLEVVDKFQTELATQKAAQIGCSTTDFLYSMRGQTCSTFNPIWRYYNRADRGYIEIETPAPDCYLWDMKVSQFKRLYDYLSPAKTNQLTVLIAGSFS
eukprot:TRINITY_DN7542_c0_g1_i1.p1 TRINITY_DN7542_c0_g1~~TRINITY_DN7542_c0_g1_i1.p1  ORF type:complete len:446 (-),score=49.86 TRINITY_DN7542_c0_g1_i1:651-1988(-)